MIKSVSFYAVFFCALSFCLLAIFPMTTGASISCAGLASITNAYFQNYELAEYSPEGLLTLHFRVTSTSTQRTISADWLVKNDECIQGNVTSGSTDRDIVIPKGFSDFSIRFSSPTHYDVWNNASSTKLTCPGLFQAQQGCSVDIPDFPNYYTFGWKALYQSPTGGPLSTIASAFHPIVLPPTIPPVLETTLPTPEGCTPYSYTPSPGGIFSNYERAEYVNGLLRVHYSLASPFNDGRNWKARLRTHDATCAPSINTFPSSTNASTTPYARYFSLRFTSPTHWELWNDESNKKELCTLCQGDVATDIPYVSLMGSNSSGSNFFRGTPYPPVEPKVGNSSVIFIPGIQASRLASASNPSDQLWEPTIWSNDIEQLYLNPDGTSIDPGIYTTGIIDELYGGAGNIYKSFITQMNKMVATGTIAGWEALPYDWRIDPRDVVTGGVETAGGHYNMVAEVVRMASSSDTGKVTIIAHSNGGIVAKYLIDELRAQGKDDLVEQLILVAVPQLGTPKAVSTLMHGDDSGWLESQFVDQVHQRTLAESMTSAYNLMPGIEYFARVIDPVIEFDDSVSELADWLERYGHAVNTHAELEDFVVGDDGRNEPVDADVLSPNVLKTAQFAQSQTNHAFFDTWQPPEHIRVTQIVGWGLDTVRGMRYVARDKMVCAPVSPEIAGYECHNATFLDHEPIFTEDGDATVVTASAGAMATSTYYLNLHDHNTELHGLRFDRQHKDILEVDPILDLLDDLLISTTTSAKHVTKIKPVPEQASKRLRLRVLSPVSISVADSFGVTTSVDGENIPNSYYIQFGEGKYVGLDANDTYTITLEGLDTGTFTLEVDEITGDQTTVSFRYPDLPVIPATVATLAINPDSTGPLNIDVDGNGSVDVALNPNDAVDAGDSLQILSKIVNDLNVKAGIKKSLLAKINAGKKYVAKGDTAAALDVLTSLQSELSAQSTKSLDQQDVLKLMQIIETVKNSL